jgi:hypothetical protein
MGLPSPPYDPVSQRDGDILLEDDVDGSGSNGGAVW